MADRDREDPSALLKQRLLAEEARLPTSSLRRFGRLGLTALRGVRAVRKARRAAEDALPDAEQLARIVSSIGQLKGVAMKVGQIMSYIDVALPEELRGALAVLQTHAQPLPFATVQEILRRELPARADELLAALERVPVAAASIGQVHRGRLADGTTVAVKVRYPEIERAIASDFAPAAIGTRIASLVYPGARIDDFVNEARARFLEECDYVHEARAQQRFGELFAGDATILVPAVHPAYCARGVLTTTFVVGRGFADYLASGAPQAARDRIGRALFLFYVGTLFRHGLYNCDPHPGNYLFCDDGRVALLDYGCTREFAGDFVARLAQLTRAVHADDAAALHEAFCAVGLVQPGRRYDFDTARRLVRGFFGPMLRDEEQAIDLGEARDMRSLYQSKKELLRLSLPGEFLFLFRIRFGLLSVLAQLGARANWYRLERELVAAC